MTQDNEAAAQQSHMVLDDISRLQGVGASAHGAERAAPEQGRRRRDAERN